MYTPIEPARAEDMIMKRSRGIQFGIVSSENKLRVLIENRVRQFAKFIINNKRLSLAINSTSLVQ